MWCFGHVGMLCCIIHALNVLADCSQHTEVFCKVSDWPVHNGDRWSIEIQTVERGALFLSCFLGHCSRLEFSALSTLDALLLLCGVSLSEQW